MLRAGGRSQGTSRARLHRCGAVDSGAMPIPRTVTATRYVTPLREGGSLPGLSRRTTTACTS